MCLLLCGTRLFAQSNLSGTNPAQPTTLANSPTRDTNANKTNTAKWKTEEAHITYERLNTAKISIPDSSLHGFQHRPLASPYERDMGNLGSPTNNLLFTPEDRLGPTLGYHIFDPYRFNVDSLKFYNTNRPYSDFSYMLGSKLEQIASIMHSQNIKPNWNFMVEYHKLTAPGFYKIQRNNFDNFNLTTNYKSLDKHYVLYAAMVYNKEQHDENGGIVNDSELQNPNYNDRRTVDAAYQNDQYSLTRSSVSNVQRDFTLLLQHSYTWGRKDTTYNADSTQFTYKLVPHFSITHKMELSTEKHTYKDLTPDSLRYVTLFNQAFSNETNSYAFGEDSVYVQQKWFWVDNKILLNGFLGKPGKQLQFSAGIGDRYDQFISTPVSHLIQDSLPKQVYSIGRDKSSYINNYLVGEIRKEALLPGQWAYGAKTQFYFTGEAAGEFMFDASVGKELKKDIGSFVAGFKQQLNEAPYSYTTYENQFTQQSFSFNKESVTTLYATLESPRLRFSAGVKNYTIDNYIYVNENEVPAQYSQAFNLSQLWVRKMFKMGDFYLDNEIAYQQLAESAPIDVPKLMGREQLTYEQSLFKKALKVVFGIEARYTTNYHAAGYDAILNKFYYQSTYTTNNFPEMAVFINFRIKRFRAFIMGDQLQEFFVKNTITNVGTPVLNYNGTVGDTRLPVYATPDALIRFGFTWILVN